MSARLWVSPGRPERGEAGNAMYGSSRVVNASLSSAEPFDVKVGEHKCPLLRTLHPPLSTVLYLRYSMMP